MSESNEANRMPACYVTEGTEDKGAIATKSSKFTNEVKSISIENDALTMELH